MNADIKAAQVNLRLSPAMKAAAEKAAALDHRSLTSLVEKALATYLQSQPSLEAWHDRSRSRALRLVAEHKIEERYRRSFVTRSYQIKTAEAEIVPPHQLQNKLRLVSQELDKHFSVGIFYPYTRSELLPYFNSDSDLKRGATDEVLECFGFPPVLFSLEFWRISGAGFATDIRPLFEDRPNFVDRGLEPGRWFCPFMAVRDLAVIVYHAQQFAKEFPSAERVEFRCEWSGLLEREIADPDPQHGWLPGKFSRVDHRVTTGEWALRDLHSSWPQIIGSLVGPVIRLFDPEFPCSPEWIRSEALRFKR